MIESQLKLREFERECLGNSGPLESSAQCLRFVLRYVASDSTLLYDREYLSSHYRSLHRSSQFFFLAVMRYPRVISMNGAYRQKYDAIKTIHKRTIHDFILNWHSVWSCLVGCSGDDLALRGL